jgi:hypothetical protein
MRAWTLNLWPMKPPAHDTVLPIAMTGFRHVPLAARHKGYPLRSNRTRGRYVYMKLRADSFAAGAGAFL